MAGIYGSRKSYLINRLAKKKSVRMSEDWSEPRPLIQSDGQQFVFDEDTAYLIESVSQPMVVVAIAGIYRTGKSYLMNRLANKQSGFPLGDTLQSKTKGIWAWCLPHPSKPGHTLLLLDTEGLSDPEKASEEDDIQILCLTVLLSSLFAYNAIGKIDQEMINRLYFLTEVLDSISIKANKSQDAQESCYEEYRNFLPDFVLIVRDFSLELVVDNKVVTPDEYFNLILQPRPNNSNYNRPRQAIQSAFRSHRCFVFARPVENDDLFCKLENLKESDITPTFLQQSKEFCQFVYSSARVKKIKKTDAFALNGKVWLSMAREYTSAINNGAVPAIETTFECVADRNNEQAVCQSMEQYYDYTKQLALPLSYDNVNYAHRVASKQAIKSFVQQVIGDERGTHRRILNDRLTEAFAQLCFNNEQVSRSTCSDCLYSIYNNIIQPKFARNSYVCTSGYEIYQADLLSLQQMYNNCQTQHGCMHDIVLNEFLLERQGEAENVRRTVIEYVRKINERKEEKRAAAEAKRRAEEARERLDRQRRHADYLRRIQEEEEQRAREEYEQQMEECRRRREAETERRLQEEEEERRRQHEEELDRLRRLRQQANDSDSDDIECCIL